jgi:hypothetical protein
VSIPVSKATSWLGQAARPFRGSRRSVAELCPNCRDSRDRTL